MYHFTQQISADKSYLNLLHKIEANAYLLFREIYMFLWTRLTLRTLNRHYINSINAKVAIIWEPNAKQIN